MLHNMKSVRFQIVLPAWLKEAVQDRAEILNISMAEYVKDALKEKLDRENERERRPTERPND